MEEYVFHVGDRIIGYGETYSIDDIYDDGKTALVTESWKSEDDGQYRHDTREYAIGWDDSHAFFTQVLLDSSGNIAFYATNVAYNTNEHI